MAFCTKCGERLEDDATVCPKCGEPTGVRAKVNLKLHAHAIVAGVLSLLAFVFGFILTTTFFVTNRGIAYTEYVTCIPSLAAIVFGILCLCNDPNKESKLLARISIALAVFALVYAFVGFMIVAA